MYNNVSKLTIEQLNTETILEIDTQTQRINCLKMINETRKKSFNKVLTGGGVQYFSSLFVKELINNKNLIYSQIQNQFVKSRRV